MKIIQLHWISKSAKEAEIIVSDGIHQCLVFSHPCSVNINEVYNEPLHTLFIEDLMLANVDEEIDESIAKINEGYFAHYCIGRVVNREENIVGIGGIKIIIDEGIPFWANNGDLIEFKCVRLDLW